MLLPISVLIGMNIFSEVTKIFTEIWLTLALLLSGVSYVLLTLGISRLIVHWQSTNG